MEAYGEALVLEPGNVTAKLLLALAHADLGETAEARALLNQCDRRDSDTPAIRNLRERLEAVLDVAPVPPSGPQERRRGPRNGAAAGSTLS
jgi:thioredoxin-like negative regulator of GroEL